MITLTGTNFNAGTEVVFPIRDSGGNVSLQSVVPLVINPAGTSLQVQVPTLATTGAIQVVNVASRNLGFNGSYNDAIYRGLTVQFTAGASTSSINFADGGLEGIGNESWGIDNVSVAQGATTVFTDNFESGTANAAWVQSVVDASTPGVFTNFLGRFSNGGDTLNLAGLTAGQVYTLHFDLYALDSLDGQLTTYGPDEMNVTVDGVRKLNLLISNETVTVQNFNGSATLPLQIVPTLTGMDGSPSDDGTFNLFGSGFQAGATAITVGGVTLPDSQFVNQYQFQVLGGNAQERIVAPLVMDGPVTVTTAGGSATLPGYKYLGTTGVVFTGITATAASGVPAATGVSANVGQTIALSGQGFTNSTLVQFSAEDSTGAHGTVTRTGTASPDGRTLTIAVPQLARTGMVTGTRQPGIVPIAGRANRAVDRRHTRARQHDRTGNHGHHPWRVERDDRWPGRDGGQPAQYGRSQSVRLRQPGCRAAVADIDGAFRYRRGRYYPDDTGGLYNGAIRC